MSQVLPKFVLLLEKDVRPFFDLQFFFSAFAVRVQVSTGLFGLDGCAVDGLPVPALTWFQAARNYYRGR